MKTKFEQFLDDKNKAISEELNKNLKTDDRAICIGYLLAIKDMKEYIKEQNKLDYSRSIDKVSIFAPGLG